MEVGAFACWLAVASVSAGQPARPSALPGPDGITLPARELAALADVIADPKHASVNWPRWRFLSFNAGPPEQLAARQAALRYAIATLNKSRATPKDYLQPMAAGVLAVDTAALGWPGEFWDSFAREEHYYSAAGGELLAEFFRQKTGTAAPLIRADQFLAGCWEPDRYAMAVAAPATREEFQRQFVSPGAGAAGLFGVVTEKLSVSRHPGKFARLSGPEGAVWMRVLYASPSDPQEARLTALEFQDGDHYEFSWQLPNNLDAYATYDRRGRLALTVPTTISRDREGESVRMGVSCLACHAGGARALEHADPAHKLVLFGASDLRQWDQERLAFQARLDSRRVHEAVFLLTGATPTDVHRAVRETVDAYRADLTGPDIARELGLADWRGPASVSRAGFADIVSSASSSRVNRIYLEAIRKRVQRPP